MLSEGQDVHAIYIVNTKKWTRGEFVEGLSHRTAVIAVFNKHSLGARLFRVLQEETQNVGC